MLRRSPVRITPAAFHAWRAKRKAEDPSWLLCEVTRSATPFWFVRQQPMRYLSMLRCFFEKRDTDESTHFQGLEVLRRERAMHHFQRHPVVALSFRGVSTVGDAERVVRASFAEHAYLRHHPRLSPVDRMIFRRIVRDPLSEGLSS